MDSCGFPIISSTEPTVNLKETVTFESNAICQAAMPGKRNFIQVKAQPIPEETMRKVWPPRPFFVLFYFYSLGSICPGFLFEYS